MRRSVDFYMVPDDPGCKEIKEFLEQQDIALNIRDVSKRPLNFNELSRLIRHLSLKHFLNTSSKTYSKKMLDKELPERQKVIQMLADDNDLLRKPIIVAGRLMVIGPNRFKVIEMLQLKRDGGGSDERANEKKYARTIPIAREPEAMTEIEEKPEAVEVEKEEKKEKIEEKNEKNSNNSKK